MFGLRASCFNGRWHVVGLGWLRLAVMVGCPPASHEHMARERRTTWPLEVGTWNPRAWSWSESQRHVIQSLKGAFLLHVDEELGAHVTQKSVSILGDIPKMDFFFWSSTRYPTARPTSPGSTPRRFISVDLLGNNGFDQFHLGIPKSLLHLLGPHMKHML